MPPISTELRAEIVGRQTGISSPASRCPDRPFAALTVTNSAWPSCSLLHTALPIPRF